VVGEDAEALTEAADETDRRVGEADQETIGEGLSPS